MGNALQARNNVTGAMEFYNYATVLNPHYQEAIRSLMIVKCQNRTKMQNHKSSEEILAEWVRFCETVYSRHKNFSFELVEWYKRTIF